MFEEIKGKLNIVVTGGAGFIGSHLVDELIDKEYNVIALDNLSNGSIRNLENALQKNNFTFIKGDILNKDDCFQNTRNVDIVFHLACLGIRHSIHSPFENHRVNAEGTLNILEACKQNGVRKFFYISSSEIYGDVNNFPIKEEYLPLPKTIYGASKLAGEYYTSSYHTCYKLDTTILRIFNNYGPRAHYEGDAGEIIPRSIVNILYNNQPIIFGDGKITRDFFFVKDTARALRSLIRLQNINGMTMNIGTGIELTMKYIVEKLLFILKRESLGVKYLEDRPADVPRLWVDAERFKSLTKFVPDWSFEEGLVETIRYYKKLIEEKNLMNQIKIRNWEID